MKYIKNLTISLVAMGMMSGCISTKGYIVTVENNKTNLVEDAYIEDNVQIKLINEYNEIYKLEDVIIKYGTHSYNPLEYKGIEEEIISTDESFNTRYSKYSKHGITKSFFGSTYMVLTDEALLALLANEYSMKIIIVDTLNNENYKIDFSTSNIILTRKIRQDIYFGFADTLKYYNNRQNDK